MSRKKKKTTRILDTYCPPPAGSRLLVYVRFSDPHQDAFAQEPDIHRVLEEAHWTIYPGGWFKDEAKSGRTTIGREGFDQMMQMAWRMRNHPNRPDGILVWKFDRAGRDQIDLRVSLGQLRQWGYRVFSIKDHIPPGSLAPIIESIYFFIAEQYSQDLSDRVSATFQELKGQGYEHNNRSPIGFRAEKTILSYRIDGSPRYGIKWLADWDNQADILRRIQQAWEMKAQDKSHKAILRGPLRGLYKTPNSLSTFFRNHRYVDAGVINEELFQQVQTVIQQHHPCRSNKGTQSPGCIGSRFLFSGRTWCDRCGRRMQLQPGAAHGYRYMYLECPNCKLRVRADLLQAQAIRYLWDCLKSPEWLQDIAAAVQSHLQRESNSFEAREMEIRKAKQKVERQINRLADLLAEDAGLDRTRYLIKVKEAELHSLQAALQQVEAEASQQQCAPLTPEDMAARLEELVPGPEKSNDFEEDDIEQMKLILGQIVTSVNVDENRQFRTVHNPMLHRWFGPEFSDEVRVYRAPRHRRSPALPANN